MYSEKEIATLFNNLNKLEVGGDIKRILEKLIHSENFKLDSRDRNYFILENFYDQMSKEKNLDMNLYPSDNKSSCREFCLGIASLGWKSKKRDNKIGFNNLMENIILYWLSCNRNNRTNLILTSDWYESGFTDNWKEKIDSYVSSGKQVVIIWLSANGPIITYPTK
jgi:hypothetical protein